MGDGYDVYVVTDASGGVVGGSTRYGHPPPRSGGCPTHHLAGAMAGELQRDWARTQYLEMWLRSLPT